MRKEQSKKEAALKGIRVKKSAAKWERGEDDPGYFQVEGPGLPPVCEAVQSHFWVIPLIVYLALPQALCCWKIYERFRWGGGERHSAKTQDLEELIKVGSFPTSNYDDKAILDWKKK